MTWLSWPQWLGWDLPAGMFTPEPSLHPHPRVGVCVCVVLLHCPLWKSSWGEGQQIGKTSVSVEQRTDSALQPVRLEHVLSIL